MNFKWDDATQSLISMDIKMQTLPCSVPIRKKHQKKIRTNYHTKSTYTF